MHPPCNLGCFSSNGIIPMVSIIFLMIKKTIPAFGIISFDEKRPKLHVGA
jgi:hypothetical protein